MEAWKPQQQLLRFRRRLAIHGHALRASLARFLRLFRHKLRGMKIAFPTRDNETIVGHFGNMSTLLVIDINNGVETGREHRDMSGMPACGDGENSRPDYVIGLLEDCDVLIANGIGAPLVHKAKQVEIDVVLTSNRSIDDALTAFTGGSLEHEPELAHEPPL